MDVGQRPEELVDVKLDLEHRHRSLEFVEVARCAVHRLGDILEDEVEIDFIFLLRGNRGHGQPTGMRGRKDDRAGHPGDTYPVAVGVVKGFEFDNVRMAHNPHDLQLTVLERLG